MLQHIRTLFRRICPHRWQNIETRATTHPTSGIFNDLITVREVGFVAGQPFTSIRLANLINMTRDRKVSNKLRKVGIELRRCRVCGEIEARAQYRIVSEPSGVHWRSTWKTIPEFLKTDDMKSARNSSESTTQPDTDDYLIRY